MKTIVKTLLKSYCAVFSIVKCFSHDSWKQNYNENSKYTLVYWYTTTTGIESVVQCLSSKVHRAIEKFKTPLVYLAYALFTTNFLISAFHLYLQCYFLFDPVKKINFFAAFVDYVTNVWCFNVRLTLPVSTKIKKIKRWCGQNLNAQCLSRQSVFPWAYYLLLFYKMQKTTMFT